MQPPKTAKPRFFAEFEFEGVGSRRYWLLLTIDADDAAAASDFWLRLRASIQQRYTLRRAAGPELVVSGLNSELISEYKKVHARGRLVPLHISGYGAHSRSRRRSDEQQSAACSIR